MQLNVATVLLLHRCMSVHIFTEPDSLSNILRVDAKIYNFGMYVKTQHRLIGKDLAKVLYVILLVAIGAFTYREASTPRMGLTG